jgi:hypothetical protein
VDGSHKEEVVEHCSEANKEDKFSGEVQNNKRHNTELRAGRNKVGRKENWWYTTTNQDKQVQKIF